MLVYDKNKGMLLQCCSAVLEQTDDERSGRKGIAVVFSSADGKSIKRRCWNATEADEYMAELAAAVDVTETLIIVEN